MTLSFYWPWSHGGSNVRFPPIAGVAWLRQFFARIDSRAGEMLDTIIILATIVFHLGVGMALALRGRLLLAALVSAVIVALPLICIASFGTPYELDVFIGIVATPLGAISFLVGLAGVVMVPIRWVRKMRCQGA